MPWIALLGAGLVLLHGRYDWSPETAGFARRGWLSSGYLLVATLPTLYWLVHLLSGSRTMASRAVFVVATVATLPYRWLGLQGLYYDLTLPPTWEGPEVPTVDWLPGAFAHLSSMPYELTFFALLTCAGLAVAAGISWGRGQPLRPAWPALFLLLVVQTWMHLSLRSPYVYITRHERPPAEQNWYVTYLFPGGQGAANADYLGFFRPMDDHFMGTPVETHPIVIRRSYVHWITTQVSYFVSPYYVYLVVNVVLWFLACLSTHRLAQVICGPAVARFSALFVATGPGFIMYVAQPMSYVAAHAVVAMVFLTLERALARDALRGWADVAGFGATLGLASMVYDGMPALWPGLLLYGWVRRASLHRLSVAIGLAWSIGAGFLALQERVLDVDVRSLHGHYHDAVWTGLARMMRSPEIGETYVTIQRGLRAWLASMVNAFFVVPVLLALGGMLLLQGQRRALAVSALGLPSLIAVLVLQVGGAHWGDATGGGVFPLAEFPRFAYIAYPAVYLLAAICIVESRAALRRASGDALVRAAADALPWAALALVLVLANIDAFGYPQMYYLFYYPAGGKF